jgi:hypothetical protein
MTICELCNEECETVPAVARVQVQVSAVDLETFERTQWAKQPVDLDLDFCAKHLKSLDGPALLKLMSGFHSW